MTETENVCVALKLGLPPSVTTKEATVTFTDLMGKPDVYATTDGFTITVGTNTPPTITEEPSSATVPTNTVELDRLEERCFYRVMAD
jgi:hypothetical protein